MCLESNIQTFDPPKQEIVKAFKVFRKVAFDLRENGRFALESLWKGSRLFETNVWIVDECNLVIGRHNKANDSYTYLTGFHAFTNQEQAIAVTRNEREERYEQESNQKVLCEVELTDIVAEGRQYLIGLTEFCSTKFCSTEFCSCIVGRKMKIGKEIPC